MAASLNKVMLIGNLGADPVIRQTQDGKRLAQLSLATSESWKDKATGEKKEKTSWHRIVIFNDGLAKPSLNMTILCQLVFSFFSPVALSFHDSDVAKLSWASLFPS